MKTVEYAVIAREVCEVSLLAVWEAGCKAPSWGVRWHGPDGPCIEAYEDIDEALYAFPELDLELRVVANLRDAMSHAHGDEHASVDILRA